MMAIICPRVESGPTRSACRVRAPRTTRTPLRRRSPGFLASGRGSPVREDSSTSALPERIVASAATTSPSATRKLSPG